MNDLIQDIWQDLREKRLWPVAAVLALAIVAIPVVLAQGKEPAAAPEPIATPAPDATAARALELNTSGAASSSKGSSLDVFSKKNPFKPPKGVTSAQASVASATAAGADGATGTGTPAGGGNDGGTAPPSGDAPQSIPAPTTTAYEYVADVTFWNGDRRRTIKGMRKLAMLPSQSAPVLIFMGASDAGGNAVFLVDSTLKAFGEGNCVPSNSNCAFVHIGPGSEEAFTTEDGDTYRIRIDEIRRVKARKATSADASPMGASASAVRRFALPSLADVVEVTAVEVAESGDEPSEHETTSR